MHGDKLAAKFDPANALPFDKTGKRLRYFVLVKQPRSAERITPKYCNKRRNVNIYGSVGSLTSDC